LKKLSGNSDSDAVVVLPVPVVDSAVSPPPFHFLYIFLRGPPNNVRTVRPVRSMLVVEGIPEFGCAGGYAAAFGSAGAFAVPGAAVGAVVEGFVGGFVGGPALVPTGGGGGGAGFVFVFVFIFVSSGDVVVVVVSVFVPPVEEVDGFVGKVIVDGSVSCGSGIATICEEKVRKRMGETLIVRKETIRIEMVCV
jgi:hypothetical protein